MSTSDSPAPNPGSNSVVRSIATTEAESGSVNNSSSGDDVETEWTTNTDRSVHTFSWSRIVGVLGCIAVVVFGIGAAGSWLWQGEPGKGSPEIQIDFAAFLGRTFTFHMGLMLVAVGVAALLVRRKRLACISLLIGAACITPEARYLIPRSRGSGGAETLTIMSYNVLAANSDARRVLDEVRRVNPDVLLLQEYTQAWSGLLREQLATEYPHIIEEVRDDATGQATYSKRPFIGVPRTYPPGSGWTWPQIRVSIAHDGGIVHITNLHLAPPARAGAVIEQWQQATTLSQWTTRLEQEWAEGGGAGEEQPVASGPGSAQDKSVRTRQAMVLMGDFNFVPAAACTSHLRRAGLVDAHLSSGRGRGATWPDVTWLRYAPGVRIDQSWHTPGIRSTFSAVGESTGSDHLPIYVIYSW